MVGRPEATCRQLFRRAKQHLVDRRPRFPASSAEQQRMTESFLRAAGSGDLDGLLALLAEDVTVYSDGGGKVVAARRPVRGAELVARFLVGIVSKAPPGLAITPTRVNGRPGLVTTLDGRVVNVVALDVVDDRIRGIYIVVNPDKLRSVKLPT